ncbi:MAG: 2-iminoacetate synthase ThiH, partial [Deltaproteobacteria bacterium]|nr:2-iminoacetate synthase ThiH [Deltaproteobacteria bacterium]
MISLPSFKQLKEQIRSCTDEDVQRSLRSAHLNTADLAALLSPAADKHLEALAARSAAITKMRFGRTTQIYAPLYVSSFCTNRCSYCGFSADNKIERRLLTLAEAEAEAMILQRRGFNHILLVSGEAPAKLGADYLEKLTLRLRDRFASISIEVQPLSTEEYTRLFKAGVTSVAIYQETYDRETYKKVHLSGQKCDFDFRLETPARAAAGGMREVGIGTLLGLADWRAEGLALGMHLAWLRKNFWRTGLTVSFPRLRPAAGEFQPLSEVKERDLSQLIFSLRIFDPDVGIILSTREEARYRNGMVG